MSSKRPVILVLSEFYLPGYKSGGGMRTIVNMVERLSDHFDFRIITSDHDGHLDQEQYDSVRIEDWNQIGPARVFYLPDRKMRAPVLKKLIRDVRPAAVYTNSFFSKATRTLLRLRSLRQIDGMPVVLAPCGELSQSALAFGSARKKLYLRAARVAGLYRDVLWKASNSEEEGDIRRVDRDGRIVIAPDLVPRTSASPVSRPTKAEGSVRFVWVGRIVAIKNIAFFIELLREQQGDIEFHVYGPVQDVEYWERCSTALHSLPSNVRVSAHGPIPHEDVRSAISQHHFLVMPSLSENFGHSILEALAAGCPPLMSDRVPWTMVGERSAGWVLPLEDRNAWSNAIANATAMGNQTYLEMSAAARSLAEECMTGKEHETATESLLREVLRNDDFS
jgi:glycosyltransferase involved in cell wall biosynthesis